MGCRCKDNVETIKEGIDFFNELRELFVKRMTTDSETSDRRRRDFNEAIFHYKDKDDVDSWNVYAEKYGLPKKEYGDTYPVWTTIDMAMVLRCFDDAIKDWRKSWCDVENCTRKI